MARVHRLENLDLPQLEPFRTMRWQAEHRRQGFFIAEGEKVVRRLLDSPLQVLSVLLPPRWYDVLRPVLEARPDDPEVYIAPKQELEKMTGFSMYQGLLAMARVPVAPTLKEVLTQATRPRLLAAVDGLTNAENLGALVRNCVAFGAQALLVGETCGSPYLRRAVRSSMGTVFKLPILEVDDLALALRSMSDHGVKTVAAHPHTRDRLLSATDLQTDCCVVFGSEGLGLSPEVIAACQAMAVIPMCAEVDSLNVASAAAAFLYEARRQRGWAGIAPAAGSTASRGLSPEANPPADLTGAPKTD